VKTSGIKGENGCEESIKGGKTGMPSTGPVVPSIYGILVEPMLHYNDKWMAMVFRLVFCQVMSASISLGM
jgi:hypothetical protein